MTQSTVQSFFSGGTGKSAKFEKLGDSISGTITAVHPPEEYTDPKGVKKTDKNGNAMLRVRIELATEERNPEIEYDDGARTLYVTSYMTDAVGIALRNAGAQKEGPELGGKLTVTLSELVPNPGLNPSKKYTAVYEKPSGAATSSFFNGSSQASESVSNIVKPEGITQAVWNGMNDAAKKQLAQAMSTVSEPSNDQPPF